MSVIVFGGYGTFGSLVARELAQSGIEVTVAGRNGERAAEFAKCLGPAHQGIAAEVNDAASCRSAIAGHAVAVNCAGPFQRFGPGLLEACLEANCHYADIADDRRYCALVREFDSRFRDRRLAAIYGCSSLPAISGALGLLAGHGVDLVPNRARVTLFIGNDNPKGGAAIRSLVHSLGKPIRAPQGVIRVFRDREVVPLPEPFGRRAAFNVESPEYDLLPACLGVKSVCVKVVFELRQSTFFFAALALLGKNYGERTARFLERVGSMVRRGTSGGAIMTELFYTDGWSRRAALFGRRDGQRMAALPCVLAVQALLASQSKATGSMTAYEFLGAEPLLEGIVQAGFELQQQ